MNAPAPVLTAPILEADLETLLAAMREAGASDLHLASGHVPAMRVNGTLQRLHKMGPAPADWMATQIDAMAENFDAAEYAARMTVDFGHTAGGGRFRINLFRHRDGDALVARLLGSDFSSFAALNLPEEVSQFAEYGAGLVLICGATGSGKSTTLASILNLINRTSRRHILTIEDPIEYVHQDESCIVRQRELNTDTPDFASAVRAALREDPDVILVGEMRDVDTMRAALTAAETGHVVFSTLHTGDVVGSVRRLVGAFPADEQDAVRLRVSQSLKAVMAQHLIPNRKGDGRVPAIELMFMTTAIRHLIASNKLDQVYSAVESGGAMGMRTLEQSLSKMVNMGKVDFDTASEICTDTDALQRLVRGA